MSWCENTAPKSVHSSVMTYLNAINKTVIAQLTKHLNLHNYLKSYQFFL